MLERLDTAWRVVGTGVSFFVFGVAGLVVGVVILPLLGLAVRDVRRSSPLARTIIAFCFRQFIRLMRGLGVLHYNLRSFERLDRSGLLVLANHPSLIDTVFLLGFVRNSTCVVDDQLFSNSFMAGALRAAGYIRNSGGSDVFRQCTEALRGGTSVLIFPEGTRTPRSGEIRMRRGAANIAVRSARDITPVTIVCTPRSLLKGERWWQVPPTVPHFSLLVGDDIGVRAFCETDAAPALAVRRLTAYLEQYFTTETVAHAVH